MGIEGPTRIGKPIMAPPRRLTQRPIGGLSDPRLFMAENLSGQSLLSLHKERVDHLCTAMKMRDPGAEVEFVRRAGHFIAETLLGKERYSGDPAFDHPDGVAKLVFNAGVDCEISEAAAYLHDAIEDRGKYSKPEIEKLIMEKLMGGEKDRSAAFLKARVVYLVARALTNEHPPCYAYRHFEDLILKAMEDIRPIVLVLADRLYNQLDFESMRDYIRERKSRETRMFHAPLAQGLGFWNWRCRLYDTTVRDLEPEAYKDAKKQIGLLLTNLGEELNKTAARLGSLTTDCKVRIVPTQRCIWDVIQDSKARGEINLRVTEEDLLSFAVVVDASDPREAGAVFGKICREFKLVEGSDDRNQSFRIDSDQNYYKKHGALQAEFITEKGVMRIQVFTEENYRRATVGIAANSRGNPLWHKNGNEFFRTATRHATAKGITEEYFVRFVGELALLHNIAADMPSASPAPSQPAAAPLLQMGWRAKLAGLFKRGAD